MAQTPDPNKPSPKTGLALFAMVGGFLLLIMIIGWAYLSLRGN
jgi:hypothetical protein